MSSPLIKVLKELGDFEVASEAIQHLGPHPFNAVEKARIQQHLTALREATDLLLEHNVLSELPTISRILRLKVTIWLELRKLVEICQRYDNAKKD